MTGDVLIVHRRLSLDDALDGLSDGRHGAVVVFLGQVRGREGETDIVSIAYEAYQPMAEKTLAALAAEARRRFGARVRVHHRTGAVRVGETAVVVAAAAPHRAEAFDAARYVLEGLKRDAPLWKVSFEPAEAVS